MIMGDCEQEDFADHFVNLLAPAPGDPVRVTFTSRIHLVLNAVPEPDAMFPLAFGFLGLCAARLWRADKPVA
jgi:hypothetical protein